jgi:hypothetical protein
MGLSDRSRDAPLHPFEERDGKALLRVAEGELDFRMPDGSSGQPETDS